METYSAVRSQVRSGFGFALAEVETDGVFALRHGGVGGGFVEVRGAEAAGEDELRADPDLDGFGVEGDAGVAGGGEEAAPVRIAA